MVKILYVDDDPFVLDAYRRNLCKLYKVETAEGGEAGLRALEQNGPYAVVVSDQHMPGMTGVHFLAKARDIAPNTVRMMLTGNADLNTAINALNDGAIFRFMVKPVTPANMAGILEQGIEQYRLVTAEQELLEKTLHGVIKTLVEILAALNPDLFGRAQHLRHQMVQMAGLLGLDDIWSLELAALLSQIGMVTLPASLFQRLDKGITLSSAEQAIVARTPEISFKLLCNIPRLEPVARMIRYQHKHYDGSGVPEDAVAGSMIPIGARILDVLLDHHGFVTGGATPSGAFALMRGRQRLYDPRVFEAFSRIALTKDEAVTLRPPERVKLSQMRVGDVLASNMETKEGKLLIAAGHLITETLLEKILNYAEIAGIREPILVEHSSDPLAGLTAHYGKHMRAA